MEKAAEWLEALDEAAVVLGLEGKKMDFILGGLRDVQDMRTETATHLLLDVEAEVEELARKLASLHDEVKVWVAEGGDG